MDNNIEKLVKIVAKAGSELFKFPNLNSTALTNENPAKIFYLKYKYKNMNNL